MPETLLDLLDGAAGAGARLRFPEAGVSFDAGELVRRAARAAGAWRAVAEPGQPVVIAAGNGPELLAAFFGAVWAGLVPAILPQPNPFKDPARWVELTVGVARKARGAPIAAPAFAVEPLRAHPGASDLAVVAVEALADGPAIAATAADPDAPAFLQFTSGSLAAPKGVVIPHRAVVANARAAADRFAFVRGDVGVYWTPLCHDMALASCLTLFSSRSDQVVLTAEGFARDPARWLAECAGATATAAPPFAFVRAMAKARGPLDLGGLRVAAVGAEPIDARMLRAFLAWAGKDLLFAPNYGLAETVCGVVTCSPREGLVTAHLLGAVRPGEPAPLVAGGTAGALEVVGHGPPLDGHAVRVVHAGQVVADGVVGDVQLAGPSCSAGYLDDPDATAALFDGAWVRTGDVGFLSAGRLYLVGRSKDVIITRGRHVFPEEIEAVAADVPGVRPLGVCAFGEPDPAGGPERITVLYAADGDVAAAARAIAVAVADRLGVTIDRALPIDRAALPRTTSGKLRRSVARATWGGR